MITSIYFPSKFKLIGTVRELKLELQQVLKGNASGTIYFIDTSLIDLKKEVSSLFGTSHNNAENSILASYL